MDLATLKNTLSTDIQCREYLATLRWKNGFVCPKCQHNEAWKTKEMKYKCKKCGHKLSVTSGTVFQNSHVPLNKWFLAIWLFAEYGKKVTADMLQNELELGSNRTALSIIKKLKKAKLTTKIKKLGHTVEITQHPFDFRGQKIYVLVATEIIGNALGQIRIQKSEYRNKTQIIDFIKNNVLPYDLFINDLKPEQKKKQVGIVTQLLTQEDMGSDYNKLIKSPSYQYRFTKKVLYNFKDWMYMKCPKDKFEQGCKIYCVIHNSKYISMTFEELLEKLLLQKVRK
ncbi:MAG: transposase [Clostridia bacterium]|nr:transposase [Clostridia bacterium]